MTIHQSLALLGVTLLLGCSRTSDEAASPPPQTQPEPQAKAPDEPDEPEAEPANSGNDPHRVVFADRTSAAYLLLVDARHKRAPSRDELEALVKAKLPAADRGPEFGLLLELIETEPQSIDPRLAQSMPGNRQTSDLLGLHIETLPMQPSDGTPLVAPANLADPIQTRTLSDNDRASLASREYAVLLRADYRNRHAVRGLRLLQQVTSVLAQDWDALVHDPDTLETFNAQTFEQRRLKATLSNVADQIVIVPWPDKRHGDSQVRLTTRGMRRFGSVDLELDGMPYDPAFLQGASHLLAGLAYKMVRLGEFDSSGYAVELDDVVTIEHRDVVQAYAEANIEPCSDCPAEVDVHLVERDDEAHDPSGHVVARVVAPRQTSDRPDYNHAVWARSAVLELLGPPPSSP